MTNNIVINTDGACAGNPGPNEASGIRRQTVMPIPETTDIHRVFGEKREEYRQQPSWMSRSEWW